jgi:hypothetical protein
VQIEGALMPLGWAFASAKKLALTQFNRRATARRQHLMPATWAHIAAAGRTCRRGQAWRQQQWRSARWTAPWCCGLRQAQTSSFS